jgi:hypothetical protein
MLAVIERAEKCLKLIVNKALSPQATYWSYVTYERFHEPH